MRLPNVWLIAMSACLAAALSARPGRAQADQASIGGIVFTNIGPIVEVDGPGGKITFVYNGRPMTQPLDRLQWIELSAVPALGEAYRAARAGQHEQAATLFGRVAASAPDEWIGTLSAGQMVASADLAGRFVDAVDGYITWVRAGWPGPKVDPPANLPPRDSPELLLAIRRLEQATAGSGQEQAQRPLRMLLLKAYERQGDRRASELAGQLLSGPAGKGDDEVLTLSARDNALLAPVREAVSAGEFEAGLERARKAGPEVSREALAELFMLVGRCYEGKNDPAHAGLNYMRLVIHYPRDRQTPEAMLRSARIAEALGRPDAARRLYDTLAQRYAGTPQSAAARARLAEFSREPKASSSAP